MNFYLVVILFVLPSASAPVVELHRELMSASSAAVCQAHADKLAQQQRQLHAEAVRRMQGKVIGGCVQLAEMT